jgi:Tfp pilus assembly protein PilV
MIRTKESGFSAIELLITLFVLAAFLIAGVQLYNVVINDGAASRAESRASNLAYNYLRQYSTVADNPCSPATPVDGESVEVQGLIDVSVTVSVTCPYDSATSISKLEVAVSYNLPSQTVVHATFVNNESNNSESSVTSGLVAWWKLNGNTSDYVGSSNGTIIGATPTTGQGGRLNGAYSFDGSSYINVGTGSALGSLTNNFTVSAWISTSTTGNILGASRATTANGYRMTPTAFTTYGVKDYLTTVNPGANDGSWHLITFVMSSNNVTFYVDGVNKETVTHTTGGLANLDDPMFIGATTGIGSSTPSNLFTGSIDDLRVYNRVLASGEIQNLFSEGAF